LFTSEEGMGFVHSARRQVPAAGWIIV